MLTEAERKVYELRHSADPPLSHAVVARHLGTSRDKAASAYKRAARKVEALEADAANSQVAVVAPDEPLADPNTKPTKLELSNFTARNALRCLAAIDRISDDELVEIARKKTRDIAIVAGVLIDKRAQLEREPDYEHVIRDVAKFEEAVAMLFRVIQQRGIKLEIPGAQRVFEAARTIDVAPTR